MSVLKCYLFTFVSVVVVVFSPRSVLATDVYLSELMASNSSTLINTFGEAEDWIELYNDSSKAIDLSGWSLTDTPTQLNKWTFPSVTLGAKQYLVVWASGRNTEQNGELHTNFKLDGDGEYLALVRPDGTTVEHVFSPIYPDQKSDVSYGLIFEGNGDKITLSDSQTHCSYKVPAADLGTAWRLPGFDDSAWASGYTPIGYDRGSDYDEFINTDVESVMYGVLGSIYMRIPFTVDNLAELESFTVSMSYEDGFAMYLNGVAIASDNLPDGETAETLAWNASAPKTRNESLAVTMAPVFSSYSPLDYLVDGENVLVVQGLNKGVSSSDLLMQTEMVGTLSGDFQTIDAGYFSTPTPGAANTGGAVDFVADTTFSVNRGFYTNAFNVEVFTETHDAEIHYTLDGSTPTEVYGTLYSGPIPISGTTVLRAAAFRPGWEASDVDTQTYIFPADVIQQSEQPADWPTEWSGGYTDYAMDPDIVESPEYASAFPAVLTKLPTLSIVTDQENLFGSSGIYDNTTREGVAWERPASAELIHPDGSKGFQVNCGLRIQGGASRIASRSPKHSFRLLFKDIYGPSKLNYQLFEDSPVDSFDTIILRAGYNNTWIHITAGQRESAQYSRDLFARRAQAAMGQPAAHGTYVHLYVNGLYWGIYNPSERPEATFAADHMGGDKDEWDATNSAATPFTDGDAVAWNTMVTIATNGLTRLSDYESFMEYCDVVNLADYMIVNHFMGNTDWDNKNWYGARRRRTGEGYKFFCWDTETSLSSLSANSTGIHKMGKPTDLFHNARTNAEFRLTFADRLHKHFFKDGTLTPENTLNLWRQIREEIDAVVVAESARWGDYRDPDAPYTVNDHYRVEQARIEGTIFPGRTAVVLEQYSAMGLYPDLAAPEFEEAGGVFTNFGSFNLTGSTNIYYTLDGSDPREFGTGAILGILLTERVTLDHSTRVKARCFDGVEWSALAEADFCDAAPSSLMITEIMHSPRAADAVESLVSADASDFAYIELHNAGSEVIGLPGVWFADGVRFDFSTSDIMTLAPGAYILVVKDRPAFLARYPELESKIAGEFLGSLSRSGDALKVKAEGLGRVVSFTYSTARDWPDEATGAGHSLVPLIAENLSYGRNWRASHLIDGSPGVADVDEAMPGLCLNEITGHTDLSDAAYPEYDSNDWIELYNAGVTALSLNDLYLSDDPIDLLKWGIPDGLTLGAGAFVTFDEITGFHAPITEGFGINKAGEQMFLTYAPSGISERVVDAITFKGQENGGSIGRVPDGAAFWVPTVPTRDATNQSLVPRPVIAEIMYHPVESGGTNENTNLEYVELFNPSSNAVELWTVDHGELVGYWRVRGDVEYKFPSNTTFSAEARMLLTPFDPADELLKTTFLNYYGISDAVLLLGPYEGKLSNQGGRITLEKPLAPDAFDETISWVIVDELVFSEAEPWMPAADGLGYTLHRVLVDGAAADPSSWSDGMPSPGAATVCQPDIEITYCTPIDEQFLLGFELLPDTEYLLEASTNLTENSWVPRTTLENQTEYADPEASDGQMIFYRLRRND